MRGGAKKGWRWRVADRDANRDLNLLYEPGNWGDILKGIWAVAAAEAVTESIRERPLGYADPFAGAPEYPLVEASRTRLLQVPPGELSRRQAPYVSAGRLASTALLVRDTARARGRSVDLQVFDTDPERSRSWRGTEGATILDVRSGEEALARWIEDRTPADLVLIDPYDFFVRWAALLPLALELRKRSTVLVYSYNKAPRGPGQMRLYRDFRDELVKALMPGERVLTGRVPADASLARAYHDVFLLGPLPIVNSLAGRLREETQALIHAIVEQDAFEVIERPSGCSIDASQQGRSPEPATGLEATPYSRRPPSLETPSLETPSLETPFLETRPPEETPTEE